MTKSPASRRFSGNLLLRAILLGSTSIVLTSAPVPAAAQTATASISGQVRDAQGAPVANAAVTARNEGTNQTVTATSGADGTYTLSGLRPASYTISTQIGGATVTERVTVEIGQSASLDLSPAAPVAEGEAPPAAAAAGDIVVTGRRLGESRTSEVATNVSQQQIRRLPQTDRNFLAFTQLAPGVKYNDSETDRGFRSGASTASAVNVFIDGVSLKNNVLESGVAGQQNSRGNPFAQLAIQEFRVLTQNYKAEYEQAAAAIVTSVTKSGTNQFHGEAFGSYTGKKLIQRDVFDKRADRPKPDFKRVQYGASLGGPIITDKLFFFGAYEGNDQDRSNRVTLGNRSEPFLSMFGDLEGNFNSPFRSDLFFGKLSYLHDEANTVELSASRRKETDIQDFGGIRSFEVAENKKNKIDTVLGKWTYRGDRFINEAAIDFLNYNYNPTALKQDSPTFEYQGIIIFGARDGTQDIKQRALTFRNDITIPDIEMYGNHTFKAGIKYSRQKYNFVKVFHLQPYYLFRGPDYSFPQEAKLGLGDPSYSARNNIFGVFVQDDWDVTDKLQLNLGIRWDRESNMFNNKYVTPPNAAAALRAAAPTNNFDADDYITDGNDRPVFDMIQPRIGFSYDVNDDQRTVIFGGFGRYYDRNVFNNTLDERYRQQYLIGNFRFSSDGSVPGTVAWDPAYLTREGLLALQETATTGFPELFAVKNNAKPPRTDQLSLGIRQRFFRDWAASLTLSRIRGKNGYTHYFGNRANGGVAGCCDQDLTRPFGFSNILIGVDDLKTRYKALYLTIDKNYTVSSGWGLNIAYTLQKAEQNGNDLFSLDKYTAADYGYRDRPGIDRHMLVVSGLLDLPWGLKFSTLSKFGSGEAYQVFQTNVEPFFDPRTNEITSQFPKKNCLGLFARCEVDITLEKEIALFSGHRFSFAVDVFNLFNNKNYAGFAGFVCCGAPPEVFNFGEPGRLLTQPRRLQFRTAYRF